MGSAGCVSSSLHSAHSRAGEAGACFQLPPPLRILGWAYIDHIHLLHFLGGFRRADGWWHGWQVGHENRADPALTICKYPSPVYWEITGELICTIHLQADVCKSQNCKEQCFLLHNIIAKVYRDGFSCCFFISLSQNSFYKTLFFCFRLVSPGDGQAGRRRADVDGQRSTSAPPDRQSAQLGSPTSLSQPETLLLGWQSCRKANKVSEEAQSLWTGTFLNRIGQKPQFSSREKLPSWPAFASFKFFWVCFFFTSFEDWEILPSPWKTRLRSSLQSQRVGHCTWKARTDIWRPTCRKQRHSTDDTLTGTPVWISKNTCSQW